MPWVKFPNYINQLLKLRAALQVARSLAPVDVANDETYGYALFEAGVISSGFSVEELRQKPRGNQGPITYGRGLPEMFQLLGLIVREGDGLRLTESGGRIADAAGDSTTDDEVSTWRDALLGFQFPHTAFPHKSDVGVSFRPAHVMLSMLERGPLPAQGLAFAFAAVDESHQEIDRLRSLAARWPMADRQELATAATTTVSELKNNAKVFPGLLEQVGLIRRVSGQAYATADGFEALGAGPASGQPGSARTPPVRLRRSRPIVGPGPASWSPDPIDPDDAAERALLQILRIERANAAHENALRVFSDWLIDRGFETAQADYDILASRADLRVLVEVKSLSAANRRRQAITAIGQLAFYRSGLASEALEDPPIIRMVFFDTDPADPQIVNVLEQETIAVAWLDSDGVVFIPDIELRQDLAGTGELRESPDELS